MYVNIDSVSLQDGYTGIFMFKEWSFFITSLPRILYEHWLILQQMIGLFLILFLFLYKMALTISHYECCSWRLVPNRYLCCDIFNIYIIEK